MPNAFLEFFGDNPNSRLLDFLISGREFDYSLSDLALNSGIGWSTLHRIFPRFEKQCIVVKTREIGRAKLYKLNSQNDEVKLLVSLHNRIIKKQLDAVEEKTLQTIKTK